MDTIKINKGNTLMVAHRGVCGIEPENTMSSFVAACNRSYMGVESDVHVTVDGEFVLIHDSTTGRVAGDNVVVEKTTYEYLKKIVLNNRSGLAPFGEEQIYGVKDRYDLRIPKLEEYINICKKYEKKCLLEIKNQFSVENIELLIEKIREMEYLENVIFISGDVEALKMVRNILPKHEIELTAKTFDNDILAILNQHNFDINIKIDIVTKEIIDIVHLNGHKVDCWTCDDRETAEKLADWGADYIITNILE